MKGTYAGFDTLCLEWMDYRLWIAPDIGGRIIQYAYGDKEALYAMPSLYGVRYDLTIADGESIEDKRRALGMQLYGGFKTWLAPQDLWDPAPYVDLDLGSYRYNVRETVDTLSVELESDVCRESAVQFFRTVTVKEHDPFVQVEMGMRNCGSTDAMFGLWDVTQVRSPGRAYFPVGENPNLRAWTEGFPTGMKVEDGVVNVLCNQNQSAWKMGTPHTEGWMLAVIGDDNEEKLGYLKRFHPFQGSVFGHGCAVELYNSDRFDYFECEVHGPVVQLSPGEDFRMTQHWSLFALEPDYESNLGRLIQSKTERPPSTDQ